MQVVLQDSGTLVPRFNVSSLNKEEQRRLLRFAEILSTGPHGVVLRRARRLTVGRTAIRGLVLISPPPMRTEDFLSFLHVALGADLGVTTTLFAAGGSEQWATGAPDAFLTAIAALLVDEAERVLRMHVSREYVSLSERRTVLSGRPKWTKDFGRHPSEGVTCLTNSLTTDTLYNALVLQGLLVARKLLSTTVLRERIENQVFIWRTLATARNVSTADFDDAKRRQNRLTEHYEPALNLSRAIVIGAGMPDVFTSGTLTNVHFELPLPGLFEQLLVRLLAPLEAQGIVARFKSLDSGAFLDGNESTYRQVEPDITLWKGDVPIAVVDAKFKPRYLRAQSDGSVAQQDRVTNEDLYQLFFYQTRLQAVHGLKNPPAAFIVAPRVNGPAPNEAQRTIQWRDANGRGSVLRVEDVDFRRMTECLSSGTSHNLLFEVCPGLARHLMAT